MATVDLSSIHYTPGFNISTYRLVIVTSEWNSEITKNLLKGSIETLTHLGVPEKNILQKYVPGSFELPLGAQFCLEKFNPDAVICLGCIIQGETRHFEFVCQAVSQGIKDVSLKYNKPVIFGVLTDDNKQQSIDRSGGKLGNKGVEAAVTALKMIDLQKS